MKINLEPLFKEYKFEKHYADISSSEKGNITFLDVLKSQDKNNRKKFNVYEIAAKIAKGEAVSAEELEYIKENSPALYKQALLICEENKKHKSNKNIIESLFNVEYSPNNPIDEAE